MCVSEFGCKCVHQTVLREARPIFSSNFRFSEIGRKSRPIFHPRENWTNMSVQFLRLVLKMVIFRPEKLDGNVVQFLTLLRKLDEKMDGNVGPLRLGPTFLSNFSSNFRSKMKKWTTFPSNLFGHKVDILITHLNKWTEMFVHLFRG